MEYIYYPSGYSYKDEVNLSRAFGHKTWIKIRHEKKALKKGLNPKLIADRKLAKMTNREEIWFDEYTEALLGPRVY